MTSNRHLNNSFLLRISIAAMLLSAVVSSSALSPRIIGYDNSHIAGRKASADTDTRAYRSIIVELENDDDMDALLEIGAVIFYHRGNLALCCIPIQQANELISGAAVKGIRRVEASIPKIPLMDVARTHFGADRIYSGEGLPSPFTGKGVVVGFCDVGFDASHPTFLTADGSESRIARIVRYNESNGERTVLEGINEYLANPTDSRSDTHATHVAGIMTGAFSGNGYAGMAPDATIVATTSNLSDVGILAGAEDIIAYAKSIDAPAVINMSVGSYTGPHDGSSLFCRYLDMLGEEAVICMASGNEGSHSNTLTYTFSDEKPEVAVRFASRQWTQFDMYGMVDAWSRDSSPFDMRFCIYDEVSHEIVEEYPVPDFSSQPYEIYDSESDERLAEYYDGIIAIGAELNECNNRYNCSIEFNAHTSTVSSEGPWARYNIAVILSGKPGTTVTIYADGQYTFLKSIPGNPNPNSKQSVSDICTGFNVVNVGMYNSRESYPLLDGMTHHSGLEPLTVNLNSGYATLIDGRTLPMTVAPGGTIISAFNRACLNVTYDRMTLAASTDTDYGEAYWYVNSGTSMSTPYVAGCIATWLQANPNLRISDIQGIIAATNRKPVKDASDPRNGMGWFDPYEGILKAIDISGIHNAESSGHGLKIYLRDGIPAIWNPSSGYVSYTIWTADGRTVASGKSDEKNIIISDDTLPGTILIINATAEDGSTATMKFHG